MAGIENNVVFGGGFKLQTSSARDISDMQRISSDISNINYIGNPETNISANPSSLCHNPTTGDIYKKASGTGNTGWSLLVSGSVLTSINIQTFTASGTYTPTANMKYCIVEGIGGGGGGGGAGDSSASSVTMTASGGGGSGGYVKAILTAAQVGASAAIVIGAGGAGGTATSNGTNGGITTFTNFATGVVFSAGGGLGGVGYAADQAIFAAGGMGGTNSLFAFTGFQISGTPGSNAIGINNTYNGHFFCSGGNGGNSFFGGAGLAGGVKVASGASGSLAGTAGIVNSGSGGGGSATIFHAAVAGAAGADGFVTITEYI
jgi:hypothetical protein